MILELTGTNDDAVDEAADAMAALAGSWDTDVSISRQIPAQPGGADRAVDPMAVSALVLSVPSTLLAVMDIADRITKRRRAKQLIAQAKTIRETTDVRVLIVVDGTRRPLETVEPEALLEQITDT